MARSYTAGSSQSIAFPSATAINVGSGDFTVMAWVRFPVLPPDNSMIVGKRAGGFDGDEGWELKIEDASNDGVRWDAQTDTTGRQRAEADLTGLTDGNWHLVGGDHTETGTSGLGLWYDGVQAAFKNATTVGSHDTATPLVIGAAFNTPNTNYITGEIGWVGIWKRLLTQGEHTALAAGFSPRFFLPLPDFLAEFTSRASPEPDIIAGLFGTLENAPTVVAGPPIIYPRSADIGQDLWYEFANATIDGESQVDATVTRARPAQATSAAQSALAVAASVTASVSATIAGQSSVVADISPEAPLGAAILAQSTVSAAANINAGVATVPIEGQSAISATASVTVPVAATVAAQSSLTADINPRVPAATTITGTSAVSATGDRIRTLTTTVAGQSALSSSATVSAGLDALVAAQSSLAGSLSATVPASSAIAGQSSIVADASALTPAATTVAGQSAVSVQITRAQPAAATIDGQSTLVVDTRALAPLETTIAGQSGLVADISASVGASTIIAAQSSVSVRPTFPGTPNTITVGGVVRWLATVGGRILR